MSVMLFGRLILVKPVHLKNALSPMVVRLFGKVMLVKLVQPENAPCSMVVTVEGRVIAPVLPAGNAITVVLSLLNKMSSTIL